MAEQARLDMRRRERLFQQRIVPEIYLPDREVIGRPPIGIQISQQFRTECPCFYFCLGFHSSNFHLYEKSEDANRTLTLSVAGFLFGSL